MPPERRARKRAASTDSCHPDKTCHIASLPSELLLHIFHLIVDSPSPSASLPALVLVCRAWHDLVIHTPTLWSNTENVAHDWPRGRQRSRWGVLCPADADGVANAKVRFLLNLCARRTHDGITRADMLPVTCPNEFRHWIATLSRSANSLISLSISDSGLYNCRPCYGAGCSKHSSRYQHHICSEVVTPSLDILQLVERAQNLERLTVELALRNLHNLDLSALNPTAAPRPNAVSLFLPRDLFGLREIRHVPASLLTWLDEVTSEAKHLTFHAFRCGPQWASWTWHVMLRRSQHLQACRILVPPPAHATSTSIELPLLEELALLNDAPDRYRGEGEAAEDPWMAKDTWFHAPSLRAIRACPTIAAKVASPSVEIASLILAGQEDLQILPHLLDSWPQLQTLTLELSRSTVGLWNGRYEDTTATLQQALDILSPATCAAVHAPKLRHLGVIFSGYPEASRTLLDQKIEWAALPWTSQETRVRFSAAISKSSYRQQPNPVIDSRIAQVEAQRRQLQQGRTIVVSSTSPGTSIIDPAHTPSAALETIKLAGLRIDPRLRDCLEQNSQAQVTCYPRSSGLPSNFKTQRRR